MGAYQQLWSQMNDLKAKIVSKFDHSHENVRLQAIRLAEIVILCGTYADEDVRIFYGTHIIA